MIMLHGTEWQPITSAPKNDPKGEGMAVFVGPWILAANEREARVARWTVEYPCDEGVWMFAYEPTDYIDGIQHFEPTHWQPLVMPTGKIMSVI